MQERMRGRHIKKASSYEIRRAEKSTSVKNLSLDEFFNECFGDLPQWAVALRGLRAREGLTQQALGDKLGIDQANISKMERGKRPIGKNTALKLAALFKSDYRIFL